MTCLPAIIPLFFFFLRNIWPFYFSSCVFFRSVNIPFSLFNYILLRNVYMVTVSISLLPLSHQTLPMPTCPHFLLPLLIIIVYLYVYSYTYKILFNVNVTFNCILSTYLCTKDKLNSQLSLKKLSFCNGDLERSATFQSAEAKWPWDPHLNCNPQGSRKTTDKEQKKIEEPEAQDPRF